MSPYIIKAIRVARCRYEIGVAIGDHVAAKLPRQCARALTIIPAAFNASVANNPYVFILTFIILCPITCRVRHRACLTIIMQRVVSTEMC